MNEPKIKICPIDKTPCRQGGCAWWLPYRGMCCVVADQLLEDRRVAYMESRRPPAFRGGTDPDEPAPEPRRSVGVTNPPPCVPVEAWLKDYQQDIKNRRAQGGYNG